MTETDISYNLLGTYAVRGEDGKLDFDATVEKFSARLTEFEAVCEKEEGAIGDAVNAVFDTKVGKGGSISMDGIVSFAGPMLNMNSDNYVILRDRIKSWVRINADQPERKDKDTKEVLVKAEPERTRAFSISKGKGGGVRRWADIAPASADE